MAFLRLLFILYIIFKSSFLQTIITQRIALYLSNKLKAEVSLTGVDISLFNSVILENVFVSDQKKDTLLFVKKLNVKIKALNFSKNSIDINKLQLNEPVVNLYLDSLHQMNYSFIIKALSNDSDTTSSLPWKFIIRRLEANNAKFSYKKFAHLAQNSGMNYSDIGISKINLSIKNITYNSDSLKFKIENISGIEKCGIAIEHFSADALIDTNGLFLHNVLITAPTSRLAFNYLNFLMKSVDDLDDFENKVKIVADVKKSLIGFKDISYFSSWLWGIKEKIVFEGKIKGKVSDFKAKNVKIEYLDNTFISGNFAITGLPNIEQTFMTLAFSELNTNASDLSKIPIYPFTSHNTMEIPIEVKRLGKIYYKGELTGFTGDFVAYGNLKTNIGNLKTDISLKQDVVSGSTKFKGNLTSEKFDLGSIVNLKETVGKISINAKVEGKYKGKKLFANIKGSINDIEFKQYTYKNIKVEGELTEKTFEGSLNINDVNLGMDFLGKIDFSKNIPVFDFTADISKLQLYKLNLVKFDSLLTLSFLLSARFSGNSLDNLLGKVELFNVRYKSSKINEKFGDISITSEKTTSNNTVQLNSNILNASMSGKICFLNLITSLNKTFNKYVPSINFIKETEINNEHNDENDFNFSVDFKDTKSICKEFIPELSIDNNTKLNFNFNSTKNIFDLTINNGNISYSGITAQTPEIKLNTENDELKYSINSIKLQLAENICMRNLNIFGSTQNNNGEINFSWDNPDTAIYKGNVSLIFKLNKVNNKTFPSVFLEANPSMLVLSNAEWYVNDAKAEIFDSLINIKQLTINSDSQYVYVNGKISKNPSDTITVLLNKLNLTNSNLFLKKYGLELNGLVSGNLYISGLLGKTKLLSNINIENFKINNEDIGNAHIISQWNNNSNNILISGSTNRGNIKTLDFNGQYYTNGNIDFDVALDKLKLNLAEPYINSIMSDIKGIAGGKLTIKGSTSKPIVEGTIKIQKASFLVPYLQTRYNFTTDVVVKPNSFNFSDVAIFDSEGNKATLNGNISHNNFNNLKFDLGIETDKLLMLNTTEKDNELFYGKAFASGVIDLTGTPKNFNIDVTTKTEKNTKIFIPLSSGSEVEQQNFIHFINNTNDTAKQVIEQKIDLSGINMNFNFQATHDAEVQIIFDSKVGDIIKGKGNGNLRLEITPTGEFKMFGDYTIESGDYLFTLQNVINKKFDIVKGGTISWNGDPYMAILDISAVYKLKASLYDLMLDSTYKQRVPVECVLNLTNNLLKPDFLFSIKLPEGDSKPNNLINSLSNEDLNKQIISLLVLNRFVTPEIYRNTLQSNETKGTNAVGMNSSELLSNQLSHWLSQISKDFDIGVNYRPGDELTHDEVELALSTQILNDRVTLNGNVGVGGNQATQSSNFVGDFEVDVKINKSGKLMVKGFNRSNTDIINDTAPYTQGLGLFYKEDFDSFSKLLQQYWKAVFTHKQEDKIKENK